MPTRDPDTLTFADDGIIPNSSLPVLVYRDVPAARDAADCERLFAEHGWRGAWRDGIFGYHHFHSNAHEVLGVAAGRATVVLGGAGGARLEVAAGDVLVLPCAPPGRPHRHDVEKRRPAPLNRRRATIGAAHETRRTAMPKYLLLKHYRGGPQPHHPFPPMDQWAPADVEAHIAFQHHVIDVLRENGEYVDAQALTPTRTWVRYGGPGAAPVTTDGPHAETSELVAGWYMIDVESYERALELAAYISSEPGPGGEPLYEWIDLREIMSEAPAAE